MRHGCSETHIAPSGGAGDPGEVLLAAKLPTCVGDSVNRRLPSGRVLIDQIPCRPAGARSGALVTRWPAS
jgi:hypothetical protein